MNTKQENKFTMKDGLCGFLRQNEPVTSALPGFSNLFSNLTDNMDKIRVIRELQDADKSGITLNKKQLRSDLIAQVLEVSRKILAYAKMTENASLAVEAYYPETELLKSTGNLLTNRASLIYDLAMKNQSALEPYDVTSELLTGFKKVIDQFSAVLPKPRLSIIERKQATDQMFSLFAANDTLLDKLDALVEVVHRTQPAFYKAYWDHRKVITTSKGLLALTAYVTNSTTGDGIRGVKVRFIPQNGTAAAGARAEAAQVKTTSEKGIFRVKSMKPGIYNAIIIKPGFKDLTMTVTIANGEMTKMTAKLEKN